MKNLSAANEFGKAFLLAADGVSCAMALTRKMLNANMVDDALLLLDMYTRGAAYTWKQLSDQIADSCWKLGLARPLADRLSIQEDDKPEIRAMALSKPVIFDNVVAHLEGRGIVVDLLPYPVLWVIAKLCVLYGFGLVEQIVDRMSRKQPAIGAGMSFKDLCSA